MEFEASVLQIYAGNKLLPNGYRLEAVDNFENLVDLDKLVPNFAKLKKVSRHSGNWVGGPKL